MLVINERIQIPRSEFEFDFARSSGPGGQNVNKVNTKVVMRWAIDDSKCLPDDVKARFKKRYRHRINKENIFLITSQRYRDQRRNIEDCMHKLAELIRCIANRPSVRKKTKPTKASRVRRLHAKQQNASKKKLRQTPNIED